MAKSITHIVFILDSSGSMSGIKNEIIELFNNQVNAVKENPSDKMTYTFATFGINSRAKVHFVGESLDNLQKLTSEDYTPDGLTPMYDAIGAACESVEEELFKNKKNEAVLVVILTDGLENASKDFSGKKVSKLVARLTDTGKWTFTVLGANISLKDLSDEIGISLANMQSFEATGRGTRIGGQSLRGGTQSYMSLRCTGQTMTNNFYEGGDSDMEARFKD